MRVGFIGIGKMGKPMAANVLKGGFEVVVSPAYGNEKPAAELEAMGAKSVPTVKEIIQQSDVIVTVLNADKNIDDVYLGADGVSTWAKNGTICIEMTTAKGETVKKLAEKLEALGKGIKLIDAPVSGGTAGAEAGALTIMLGGNDQDIAAVAEILNCMGKKHFKCGGIGSGKTIKMLNQMLNAGSMAVACETIYLGKKLGIDTDLLQEVVNESSGASWVFKNNVPKFLLAENFEGGFVLDLMAKDISLAVGEIESNGLKLPLTEQVYAILKDTQDEGLGSKNYTIIKKYTEKVNGEGVK